MIERISYTLHYVSLLRIHDGHIGSHQDLLRGIPLVLADFLASRMHSWGFWEVMASEQVENHLYIAGADSPTGPCRLSALARVGST